jgi:uncharacterized protein YbjT (DUF2867 family)
MFVVCGATGRVGSAVAAELLDRHQAVRVVVRNAAKGAEWSARGADVAVGSLDDRAFLERAFADARGVFALVPEEPTAPDFHGLRRAIADAIAGAVVTARVPHVAMISAVGVDSGSGTGPIEDLAYLESRLRDGATTLTSVRSAYFQDNVAGAIEPARRAGIVPNFGASDAIAIPMTATRDAGRFAAECLMDPPAAHDSVAVLGPAYTMRDVADALGRALGKPLQVVNIPEPDWIATLVGAGMSQSTASALAEMFGAFGSGRLRPSASRTVPAATSLEDTIARIIGAQLPS